MFHYEANIVSNPHPNFGIWTPDGWRVHAKRWPDLKAHQVIFSGDGVSTHFFGLPTDFVEDSHSPHDPLTDGGIYPSEPRVESPRGRPRWAISHTYLVYPFADQSLYVQEYVWNRDEGSIETYFREHVECEEAVTDDQDGMSVQVQHRPISRVVVGNKSYPHCNSAVRGVWEVSDKSGLNYYTQQRCMLLQSHNAIYVTVPFTPVVNCYGLWKASAADKKFFDKDGQLVDPAGFAASGIPMDAPGVAALGYDVKLVNSRFYDAPIAIMNGPEVRLPESLMNHLQASKSFPFQEHQVGYAGWKKWDHEAHVWGVPGAYTAFFDFNKNGIVDDDDAETLRQHIGKQYRVNHYSAGYFGNDWLSVGVSLNPEMQAEPVIGLWSQGAGYDAASGRIFLHTTPGPGKRVYVEYHYDKPASAGKDNIRVTFYREQRRTGVG